MIQLILIPLMKILSVNIGIPREVPFQGEVVTTGIFKDPVEGRVNLRTLNLDGDRQADLTVTWRERQGCLFISCRAL